MDKLEQALKNNQFTGTTIKDIIDDPDLFFDLLKRNYNLAQKFVNDLTIEQATQFIKNYTEKNNTGFFRKLIKYTPDILNRKKNPSYQELCNFREFMTYYAECRQTSYDYNLGRHRNGYYYSNTLLYSEGENAYNGHGGWVYQTQYDYSDIKGAYNKVCVKIDKQKYDIAKVLLNKVHSDYTHKLDTEFSDDFNLLQELKDAKLAYTEDSISKVVKFDYSDITTAIELTPEEILLKYLIKPKTGTDSKTSFLYSELMLKTDELSEEQKQAHKNMLLTIFRALGELCENNNELFKNSLRQYPIDLLEHISTYQPSLLADFFIISPGFFTQHYPHGYQKIKDEPKHSTLINFLLTEYKKIDEKAQNKYAAMKLRLQKKQREKEENETSELNSSTTVASSLITACMKKNYDEAISLLSQSKNLDFNPNETAENLSSNEKHPLNLLISRFSGKNKLDENEDQLLKLLLSHPNIDFTHIANSSWYQSFLYFQHPNVPYVNPNSLYKESPTFPAMARRLNIAMKTHELFSGRYPKDWLNNHSAVNELTADEIILMKKIIENHLQNKEHFADCFPNDFAEDPKGKIRAVKVNIYFTDMLANKAITSNDFAFDLLDELDEREIKQLQNLIANNPSYLVNLLNKMPQDTHLQKMQKMSIIKKEPWIAVLQLKAEEFQNSNSHSSNANSNLTDQILAMTNDSSSADLIKMILKSRLSSYILDNQASASNTPLYNINTNDKFYHANKFIFKPFISYYFNDDSFQDIIKSCLDENVSQDKSSSKTLYDVINEKGKKEYIQKQLANEFGPNICATFKNTYEAHGSNNVNNNKRVMEMHTF
jgi:hypothetical protein